MSTLSSTSTRAEILAALKDNASFREDNSPAKAKAFITAATIWQFENPKRVRHGGTEEVELSPETLKAQHDDAKAFLASFGGISAGGAGVTHLSFENFRS